MVKEGREVRSRTDYILGTDRRLFGNVSLRDPRHNSYHYMVLVYLHSASLKEHARYLGGRKCLYLLPPTEPTIFATLWRAVPKPWAWEAQKNAWILEITWRLIDERVSTRRDLAKYQALIRRLSRDIRESLRTDRKRREEEAGSEVGALLGSDPPLHLEAWHRIKGLYKAAVDHAPPPARVTLKRITAESLELYSYVPPRERTSPFPCSRSRWMTQFLRRTRYSGR